MIYSSDGYFRRRTAALILRPAITCCAAGEPVKAFVDLQKQTLFKCHSKETVLNTFSLNRNLKTKLFTVILGQNSEYVLGCGYRENKSYR